MEEEKDKELEFIKRKKLLRYYREYLKKQLEEVSKKDKDKGNIYLKVRQFFEEDAYNKLIEIRNRKPEVADTILKNILYMILNGLVGIPVDYVTVEYIRRKIEGESGKIYVYKKGELKEFGEALKDEK